MTRINDKIIDIETYMSELSDIVPKSYKNYEKDLIIKAACERYFEKLIEAIVDLAFLFIKEKSFGIPDDDESAFDMLSQKNIISQKLADRFKDAKRMRNFIIHQYEKIDDLRVYTAISQELEQDTKEFIKMIKSALTKI